jgi:hypothetical protein
MRKIPLTTASHPRTVTTTRQPPLQKLCTRTIAKPATKSRMPETKISPGSLSICLAISGKWPALINIATPIATSVGPIRPAIIFVVAMTFRMNLQQ